jgi:hypothetical protein
MGVISADDVDRFIDLCATQTVKQLHEDIMKQASGMVQRSGQSPESVFHRFSSKDETLDYTGFVNALKQCGVTLENNDFNFFIKKYKVNNLYHYRKFIDDYEQELRGQNTRASEGPNDVASLFAEVTKKAIIVLKYHRGLANYISENFDGSLINPQRFREIFWKLNIIPAPITEPELQQVYSQLQGARENAVTAQTIEYFVDQKCNKTEAQLLQKLYSKMNSDKLESMFRNEQDFRDNGKMQANRFLRILKSGSNISDLDGDFIASNHMRGSEVDV